MAANESPSAVPSSSLPHPPWPDDVWCKKWENDELSAPPYRIVYEGGRPQLDSNYKRELRDRFEACAVKKNFGLDQHNKLSTKLYVNNCNSLLSSLARENCWQIYEQQEQIENARIRDQYPNPIFVGVVLKKAIMAANESPSAVPSSSLPHPPWLDDVWCEKWENDELSAPPYRIVYEGGRPQLDSNYKRELRDRFEACAVKKNFGYSQHNELSTKLYVNNCNSLLSSLARENCWQISEQQEQIEDARRRDPLSVFYVYAGVGLFSLIMMLLL